MISGKCYFCMKSICTRGISLRIVRRNTNMLVSHADITWAVSLGCPWCVGVSGFLAHTRIFLWCFPGPMERYTWNPKSQGKKQVRGDEVVFRTKLMRGILVYYRAKCSDCQSQIYFCPVIINNLYSLPLNPKTTEKSLRWHLTVLLWALRDAAYGLSTENSNRAWVRSYQEGLIGALTEGRVIRAIDGRLTGELWVKLTHVVSRLLRRQKRGHAGEGVQQHEHVWNRRGCDSSCIFPLEYSPEKAWREAPLSEPATPPSWCVGRRYDPMAQPRTKRNEQMEYACSASIDKHWVVHGRAGATHHRHPAAYSHLHLCSVSCSRSQARWSVSL